MEPREALRACDACTGVVDFFRCNVRHADVLVILFSFFPLDNPIFSIHLSTFRDYSYRKTVLSIARNMSNNN